MKIPGIVAFAFGAPWTIRSNRRIAEIVAKKAQELNAPVYTQLDIHVEQSIQVEYTQEDPGNPPPTLRIARGTVRWAERHGLTELWVVAAKPHLWRALRDVQQAVREAGAGIEIHACKEIEQYPEDSWFCSDSTQDRVRSRKAWRKRELILSLMPFCVYKCVAS
ncbi:MAG: hypothetical protein HYT03_00710 [Candidatus Harrisonbacteria bacterium]|nr:hypothetical protein [Candidatus Harrisonbacteria bacterium]